MTPLAISASDPTVQAVWLSFAFYLLNLLAPIIPAVLIYWLFPEGTAGSVGGNSVEGGVFGWKIKAIGAWGAYVTAFLLGYWAINATAAPLIKKVAGRSVWTFNTRFVLEDENGHPDNTATVDKLQVYPAAISTDGQSATITYFSDTDELPDSLTVKVPGYEEQNVSLSGVTAKNGTITLPQITLRKLPAVSAALTPLPALPPGQGPPPITGNK